MKVVQIVGEDYLAFVLGEIKNASGIIRGIKGRLTQPLTHRKLVSVLIYHAALSRLDAEILADTIFTAPFGVVVLKRSRTR